MINHNKLKNIIKFSFVPEETYNRYKKEQKYKFTGFDSIGKSLTKLFTQSKNEHPLAQLILFDFYISINHPSVNKDNITGKRIEQKLSKLFALLTEDEMPKVNPDIRNLLSSSEIEIFEKPVLDLICSNNRQKGDLYFFDSKNQSIYKLSIKSLVTDNNEINFGAFEFRSAIKGIEGLENLLNAQERNRPLTLSINSKTISNIGLGSAKQLKNLFNYIVESGKLDEFLFRFRILLKGVFKDDFLLYIKNPEKFEIFLLKNEDFIEIVIEKVKNNFQNIRIEGNAIRITDLALFKRMAKYKFEFEILNVIPAFKDLEDKFIRLEDSKINLLSKI